MRGAIRWVWGNAGWMAGTVALAYYGRAAGPNVWLLALVVPGFQLGRVWGRAEARTRARFEQHLACLECVTRGRPVPREYNG